MKITQKNNDNVIIGTLFVGFIAILTGLVYSWIQAIKWVSFSLNASELQPVSFWVVVGILSIVITILSTIFGSDD